MTPCTTCRATGRGLDAHGGIDWYRSCQDCGGRGRLTWWRRVARWMRGWR